MEDTFYFLLLQIALIALGGMFAAADVAFAEANEAKLAQLSPKKSKKLKKIEKLTQKSNKFSATVQTLITFAGFFAAAFAAVNFSGMLSAWIDSLILDKEWYVHVSTKAIECIAVVIITFILAIVTLLFGNLLPRRIAAKKPDKVAFSLITYIDV